MLSYNLVRIQFVRDHAARGHPVVMGRRTWESLPASFRPVPAWENWVLTRRSAWADEGAIRTGSLTEVIEGTDGRDLWVAGGGQVYAVAIPLAEECLVTEIDAEVAGDTRAPQLPLASWRQDEAHPNASDWQVSATGARFRYGVHTRRRP